MKLRTSRGMALIVTLAILVLVTIVAVGLATVMRLERATARNNFESLQARALAEMAADHAMGLIRDATGTGSQRGKFWSSQPGRITVFNSDGTVDTASTRDLYSVSTNGTVNLNEASFGGKNPIASAASVGSGSAPAITASWINVLADPSVPASASNKIVGRYAFWVDDETAKINVNTADGSMKYSGSWYGSGTPADVNLQALKIGGVNLSQNQAQDIAKQSGMLYSATAAPRAFNSAQEIGGVPGAPATLFEENNFNLTTYSLAPELNIFGEPRIPLVPTRTFKQAGIERVQNFMLGDYSFNGTGTPGTTPTGPVLDSLYPASNQLPKYYGKDLPQNFQYENSMGDQLLDPASPDYLLGERIANYLKGTDSNGNTIKWPAFAGSGSGAFSGKYTDRQIDSIALQIMSLIKRGVLTDQHRASSLPPILLKGWKSDKIVKGLSRGPRVNEIVLQLTAQPGPNNNAQINLKIYIEWYLPEEFVGHDFVNPFDNNSATGFNYGRPKFRYFLNYQDAPKTDEGTTAARLNVTGTSPTGGTWMNRMLRIEDGSGGSAGVDLMGNGTNVDDPDQDSASIFHPWTGTNGVFKGAGPDINRSTPALVMNKINISTAANRWRIGEYFCSENTHSSAVYETKPNIGEIELKGGLAIWTMTASVGETSTIGFEIDPVPLDGLRGPAYTDEAVDLNAVIPIPPGVKIPVPGAITVHFQVADPLVNSMPGDWIATVYPGIAWRSEFTMTRPSGATAARYMNGKNVIAKAGAGGDPVAAWWPPQSLSIPKLQRFPSAGFLQSIRTGMMPDKTQDALPIEQQKGTPYRVLNFSPSTAASQQTDGGESYPDWAMLDLFTVPGSMQPLNAATSTGLTSGGATAGRLNPNGVALHSGTAVRPIPLQAALRGKKVQTDVSDVPPLADIDDVALGAAIEEYIAQLGRPLMMPGEICNIPEVAEYVYEGVNSGAKSRNDLVRQTVGNLTTQSNTFTVWAVGQVIKKKPSNQQNGQFESGDSIVGEARQQFLVERFLDVGIDGVPGNTADPGPDKVVGSHDDVVDPQYHPTMTYPLPYKYRVISAKEVR